MRGGQRRSACRAEFRKHVFPIFVRPTGVFRIGVFCTRTEGTDAFADNEDIFVPVSTDPPFLQFLKQRSCLF